MMPVPMNNQAPIPPPADHRAQAKAGKALSIDALTLVRTLHLLTLCQRAVRLAHHHCPPPLLKGPGGAPRRSREERLLLVALLTTLWRLSSQDMTDWLRAWPALALACGFSSDQQGTLPVPSPSQQCTRRQAAGAPLFERVFLMRVLTALRCRVTRARDLMIESAPMLAWRKADPDAASGHHPRPLFCGFRGRTLICRGSGLPLPFLVSPATVHDAPFARPLLERFVRLSHIHPRVIRLDAASWGLRLLHWILPRVAQRVFSQQ
jgi:hypothetical protein